MRLRRLITTLPVLALLAFGIAPTNASSSGVPPLGHVFVIIGENTEVGQINATNSPYIMGTLKPASAWLTNYFALTHFSEANYVGMMSGQFTACQQFDGSAASCHQNVQNLFSQLDEKGVSWQSWMESMPAPCYLTSTGAPKTLNHYGAKHNPAIFFDNIEGGDYTGHQGTSANCLAHDIPTGGTGPNDTSTLDAALAAGDVAQFNFIVPNECEDAHDNCSPQGNAVTQFDNFLQREVPKITNSPAFKNDPSAVLIITFDEGTSNRGDGNGHQFAGGGNVMFAAVGPHVVPGTYAGTHDHYSLLRTLEDGYGLGCLVGACTAGPIGEIWGP
jgi:hypothetical protein